MQIVRLLDACRYAGSRGVCTGSDTIIVEDQIKTIPQREFYEWKQLITVEFGVDSALISIGQDAFSGCSQLQNINFPPKLETIEGYAFRSCTLLLEIHFPASLSAIGTYTFYGCSKLVSITADENITVTTLGSSVFRSTAITTFALWKHLTTISGTFTDCMHLSAFTNPYNNPHFNVINGMLFKGTELLMMPVNNFGHFVFPANVTSISAHGCWGIYATSIAFEPDSQLTSFGSSCFVSANLSTFEFPDSAHIATGISIQMFSSCQNLKTIHIPPGIKTIGVSAFHNSGLEQFTVAPSHPTFACVDGILFSKDLSTIVVYPQRLITARYLIPKNVTSIASTAFRAGRISSIEFESGSKLQSLGGSAFQTLRQSTFSFDLDCPLNSIPKSCFDSSSQLTSIMLPRHLQTIEGDAFSNTGLTEFLIPDDAAFLISEDGVLYSENRLIIVRFPPAKVGIDYVVPSSVEIVGASAFETCAGIHTIAFEEGSKLKTVQKSAFASSKITTIVFGDDSDDVTFETGCFTSSSVQYVTLPGRMQIIKEDLFKDCFDLVGITLPVTAMSIETGAFTNCEALKTLKIPMFCQIRAIPTGAFTNTRSLTELELPYLVDSIAPDSLPANLVKLTLWGPLTNSVIDSVQTIPTLHDLYILCGRSLDTSDFVAPEVTIHQMCFSKQRKRVRLGSRMSLSIYIIVQ